MEAGSEFSCDAKLALTPRKRDWGSEVSVRQRKAVLLREGLNHWAGPEGNRRVPTEEHRTGPKAGSALGDNCTN